MKNKKRRTQPRHKVRCSRCHQNILKSKLADHMQKQHLTSFNRERFKPSPSGRNLGLIGDKKSLIKPSFSIPERRSRKKSSTGIPIFSKRNQYPIGNCFKCREEVYLVPVILKSGRRSEDRYDMCPFGRHDCESQVDPLDDPRTLGLFNPRRNRYKM